MMRLRKLSVFIELILGLAFIVFGYACIFFVYPRLPAFYANVFFGQPADFPYSFQIGMWLPFFVGAFILFGYYIDHCISRRYFKEICLPINEATILDSSHFMVLLEKTRPAAKISIAHAPRILYQVIMKYQSSKSVDQASTMLGSLLESSLHRLELKFSSMRYISWLIPSLGFMGTVYGISMTVATVGRMSVDDPTLLATIASNLAVAFDTTLLALVQAAILVYFSSVVEGKEEAGINNVGEYVLENIINRVA